MKYIAELVAMLVTEILIIGLVMFIRKQKKGQLKTIFIVILLLMFIWTTSMIMQILFQNTNIDPYLFEKFATFGAVPISLAILFLGQIFVKNKIKFNWFYGALCIIPIITTILSVTNEYHHLFIEKYSIMGSESVYGPYFIVHAIYSYVCVFIGIGYLVRESMKNSGFFSKQSIMIVIGTLVPIGVNILATFSKFKITTYVTPISYSIAVLFYAFAIFKFKFLSITPVALQKIVDRISDGYLVLNEENIITDFNKTYLEIFHQKPEKLRNKNIFSYLKENNIDTEKYENAFEVIKNSHETVRFEQKVNGLNKYFAVEINTIMQKKQFLGKLILVKDITQHKEDMMAIKNNQDILVERERLASLGQMIGGIAHNLKTPIMSISGAVEGLGDLIKEYDLSIDNSGVTSEDHHAIANDMSKWTDKIKTYLEYMSDIITAVKGQAVNFAEEEQYTFTVSELVKHVNILMKHELKNAIVYLNTDMQCNQNATIKGSLNSLVQVINNMISNAIQAYNGVPEKSIDLIIKKSGGNIVISVQDYGPGLPEKVQEKLFKEMITTKGKNGTGLGLYMSYSNIKAHFGGDISVYTKPEEGTTFDIILPEYKG